MFYDDHAPPHFHASYAEHEAMVAIDTLDVIEGSLPQRPLALVVEWAIAHRAELRNDWELARAQQPVRPIEPLE